MAIGIGIASLAFFLSGLIPSPSISLQQDNTNDTNSQIPTAEAEVVLLMCMPWFNDNPPNPPIWVYASSSSEGAPNITRFASCSQTLADLLTEGFTIQDVQVSGGTGDAPLYYTLVRERP